MSATPHLASMERRLLAFTIDTVLLVIAMLLLEGSADAVGAHASGAGTLALVALVFTGYHAVALVRPSAGIGRVVANVAVASLRGGGPLTRWQALVRPAVRTLSLALGLWVSIELSLPWIACVPWLVDMLLMTAHPRQQTFADLAAGTVVVRLPPWQPHRAPAGPMFSRDDAEFGKPPGRRNGTDTD